MLSEGKLLQLVDSFLKAYMYICVFYTRACARTVRACAHRNGRGNFISHDQSYRSMPVN